MFINHFNEYKDKALKLTVTLLFKVEENYS